MAFAELGDNVDDRLAQGTARVAWKSNQDDACGLLPTCVGEYSEVFVFGQQNS